MTGRNSTPTDNVIMNNLFVVTRAGDQENAVAFWGEGYDPLQNTFDYNLYYYVNGPDKSSMVVVWPIYSRPYSFSEWQAAGKEQHGVLGDPQFINPGNADFHLRSNSPAIDAGVDVGVSEDFDGNVRPQGAAPDIGAFEFAGRKTTSTPQPTPTPLPPTITPQPSLTPLPQSTTSQPSPTSVTTIEEPTPTPIPLGSSTPSNSNDAVKETSDNPFAVANEQQKETASDDVDPEPGDKPGFRLIIMQFWEKLIRGIYWLVDLIKGLVNLIMDLIAALLNNPP